MLTSKDADSGVKTLIGKYGSENGIYTRREYKLLYRRKLQVEIS